MSDATRTTGNVDTDGAVIEVVGCEREVVIGHPTMENETARLICERIARVPTVKCAIMIWLCAR